jgi:hypothetical protein
VSHQHPASTFHFLHKWLQIIRNGLAWSHHLTSYTEFTKFKGI